MNATQNEPRPLSAAAPRPRPGAIVGLSCAAQWLVPGLGYVILGRVGRAAGALFGIGFAVGWGLWLGGELSRPVSPQILSYLKTFACIGIGPGYWLLTALGLGRGDATAASYEFGNTFVLAAGLISYLLVLDVYDIAVGRKS